MTTTRLLATLLLVLLDLKLLLVRLLGQTLLLDLLGFFLLVYRRTQPLGFKIVQIDITILVGLTLPIDLLSPFLLLGLLGQIIPSLTKCFAQHILDMVFR